MLEILPKMFLGISQKFPLFNMLRLLPYYANSNYTCEFCIHIISSISFQLVPLTMYTIVYGFNYRYNLLSDTVTHVECHLEVVY